MPRKITVRISKKPAITVERSATRDKKIVYVICAPKPRRYANGRSRIVYIGRTTVGVRRIASSIAGKAAEFLNEWGVRKLEAFVLKPAARQSVRSWEDLEKDLLITFRSLYHRVPRGNTVGKRWKLEYLSGSFTRSRLEGILRSYANQPSK